MMKIMNIYFDIDGVLRGTASPQDDIIALLEYCLDHYPDSSYWLTTHCKAGINNARYALKGLFPDQLVEQVCTTFQPTHWGVLKTDAINFEENFIWFDDNLFESEKIVLQQHGALGNFYQTNPKDPEAAKKALQFLKNYLL